MRPPTRDTDRRGLRHADIAGRFIIGNFYDTDTDHINIAGPTDKLSKPLQHFNILDLKSSQRQTSEWRGDL